MSFHRAAYLERLHLSSRPATDADGLTRLQLAHRMAIPFENLDVMLGRGVAIDSAAVFTKLVAWRRAGYPRRGPCWLRR